LDDGLVRSFYQCTLCGACDVMCKTQNDMEPLKVLEELREISVSAGFGLPEHKAFIDNINKYGNPFGQPAEKRYAWMPKNVKSLSNPEIIYFAGCATAYLTREIARATTKLMSTMGIEFAVMGSDEFCCGKPAYKQGYINVAKNMIEHNIKKINKLGAKVLVTSCPGCYTSFTIFADEYSKIKRKFEVLHISHLINQLIDEGKTALTKNVDLKVTYHDPCELGRLSKKWKPGDDFIGNPKNYEIPRKILKSIPGLQFVEMERIKEYAYCCGSDAGWAFPDFVLRTSKHRLEEAKDTGAEAIITWCPTCFRHAARGQIKVYDASQIILMALEEVEEIEQRL
ncbi:MAG: (Fe-S)-binding protein, partial [Candidatus Bathyarchaeia archaeon]